MFEPVIFGLTALQFKELGMALITPSLAFVFLFLLALPLKKLPFLDLADDYRPPSWVLPIFALGSLSVCCYCLATPLFKWTIHKSAPTVDFFASYQREQSISLPENSKLVRADIVIKNYDDVTYSETSDFLFLVNGYRVFSSASNCLLSFQCKQSNSEIAKEQLRRFLEIHYTDQAFPLIEDPFSLPHTEDITPFLAEGRNFIDLIADNSGVQTCHLVASLVLETADKKQRQYEIQISPLYGPPSSTEGEPSHVVERLPSGAVGAPASLVELPFYRTSATNQSYRLCQRLRFNLSLSGEQTPTLLKDDAQLTKWYAKHFSWRR